MKGGWFAGDFSPSVLRSREFEAACKFYKKGTAESAHVHKIATEITLIARGRARMNGVEHTTGDIVVLDPGEASDFHALEDTITMVIKSPSVIGDKYAR